MLWSRSDIHHLHLWPIAQTSFYCKGKEWGVEQVEIQSVVNVCAQDVPTDTQVEIYLHPMQNHLTLFHIVFNSIGGLQCMMKRY